MSGLELTEAGTGAMARELYSQASGGQSWDQADADVQQTMRTVVDSMIEKAREAEAEREAREQHRTRRKGVLP